MNPIGYQHLGENTIQQILKTHGPKMSQIVNRPCSSAPPLCPFETLWRAQFKGIESFNIPAYKPIYDRDERAWQTDLNSIQFDRSIECGMEWDMYRFMDGPQLLNQFLSTDLVAMGDRHMRPVHSLESSKMVQPQIPGLFW